MQVKLAIYRGLGLARPKRSYAAFLRFNALEADLKVLSQYL